MDSYISEASSLKRLCRNLSGALGVSEEVILQGMSIVKKGQAVTAILDSKKIETEMLKVDYYGVLTNSEVLIIATTDSNNTVDDDLRVERLCPRYIVEKRSEGDKTEVTFYELMPEDYDNHRNQAEAEFRRRLMGDD